MLCTARNIDVEHFVLITVSVLVLLPVRIRRAAASCGTAQRSAGHSPRRRW